MAAAGFLQEVKQLPDALRDKGKVLQELEDAMRAKGDVTREEEALLKTCRILTKHSDDKTLVEAVKRHFFAEHLFNDQHQGRPVFRWRPRHSYIDSAFMERVKEIEANNSYDKARSIEANNSYDKARSISAHTARSFGDLMEDPLACILGSPGGDMESSKPPEHTGTNLKRRELLAHRRSHRHADKFAAL